MILRPCFSVAACMMLGCTSMAARTAADFDNSRVTQRQYQQDNTACETQAEAHQKTYSSEYDVTHGAYNWMYDACMHTSGYDRKTPQ
jgi:hypothetical protein